MRPPLILVLCVLVAGCDPVQNAYVTLAPRPETVADSTWTSVRLDSAARSAFALAADAATRYGLEPLDLQRFPTMASEYSQCFRRNTLLFCRGVTAGEIQFRLSEISSFTSRSDSLRREFTESLRARFGESRVRVSDDP